MIITCTQPPFQEPVSLKQAKNFLKIDDDNEDPLIEDIIKAARQFVEDFTGQSLLEQHWQLQVFPQHNVRASLLTILRSSPAEIHLRLPKFPVISIENVQIQEDNTQIRFLNETEYGLHTHSFYAQLSIYSSSRRIRKIKINYCAGYGKNPSQVPPLFNQAILVKCAELYENRGDQLRPSQRLDAAEHLLKPYKSLHFGLNFLNLL